MRLPTIYAHKRPIVHMAVLPDPIASNRRRAMQSNLFDEPDSAAPASAPAPQFATAARATDVPRLSPFPELRLEAGRLREGFDLSLQPRTPSDAPRRRLNVRGCDEMRKLRQTLETDFDRFSERMGKLAAGNAGA